MRDFKTGPALFMLLIVTFGLFVMHTMGHSAPSHSMTAAHDSAADDFVALDSGAHDPTGATYTVVVSNSPQRDSMPAGAVGMCVAILCGLIAFATAVMFAKRCGASNFGQLGEGGAAMRNVVGAVRGPPPPAPLGLAIANLSVKLN